MAEHPTQPPPNQQVPKRVFIPKHNQVALLDPSVRGIDDYLQIIQFLRRYRIFYAITTKIPIVDAYMQDFWTTAHVIGDLDIGNICYVAKIRDRSILRFGYSGNLPFSSYHNGMLREKWRFFLHIIMQCFSPRKAGFDGMSHNLLSAMIGLTFNQPYNVARMIFQALKAQLDYVVNDPRRLLLYPRFLMIIFGILFQIFHFLTDYSNLYFNE
ncbi:hypothetical protein Hanom_Chr02g00111541 [Helianthus anomalus]